MPVKNSRQSPVISCRRNRRLAFAIPLMAIHVAAAWKAVPRSTRVRPWFTGVFVLIGMPAGFYSIYLVSPYELRGFVQSSLDRLLLQLWPIAVFVYSAGVSLRSPESAPSISTRKVLLRVAAVLILTAAILVFNMHASPERPAPAASVTHPALELNRTEVRSGESFTIRIAAFAARQVYLSYSIDDKPMGQIAVRLGKDGSERFQVSATTQKGTYRFLAVRPLDDPSWIDFDIKPSITVR